jgi:hypothetical protein
MAKKSTEPTKPESKQFSLKAMESQVLAATQSNFMSVLSNVMAMIAIERLAYQVTPYTRFTFNEDFSQVTISEDEPQPDPEKPAEDTPPVVNA